MKKSIYDNIFACIYCLENKNENFFNIEHVLPQAFGKFNNNLTLKNKVCQKCNSQFSRLDENLARNTIEGAMRPFHIRKKSKCFEKPHKSVKLMGAYGIFKGLNFFAIPSDSGEEGFNIFPDNKIGLLNKNNEYEYISIEEIPSKKALKKNYCLKKDRSIVIPAGVDKKKGFCRTK